MEREINSDRMYGCQRERERDSKIRTKEPMNQTNTAINPARFITDDVLEKSGAEL